MRSSKLTRRIVVQGLICAVGVGTAFADAPAPKWYDTIGVSGYAQTSYVGNLENSPANQSNQGRQFDGAATASNSGNSFSFNRFLLQIAKPVSDSDHYGFTVRLAAGQDATFLPSSGGNNFAVQEAYLTYAATSKLSIVGGRFVTPEGFEVVDSVSNPNFSEGLLFTYAEPISHTGVKATYTFSDKVNATIGVVNGWNVDTDNNSQKTIMWQVATTPTKMISWSFQGLYGNELAHPQTAQTIPGPAASDHADTLSLDTVASLMPTDKLTLAVQGNWGQQTHDPNTTAGNGTSHWIGAGLWASFAETSKLTSSARFEVMGDQNSANRFAATTFADGTTNQTVKEFTLTQKLMLTSAMGVRGEYRHDWSNQAYFVRSDGSAVRNQNTLSADWFVTF